MLSKTGKFRLAMRKITRPHLALIKIEIQAEGWFFICSLDFLPTFLSRKKWGRNPEVAKLRVSFFETESFQTTPSLRATHPAREIKDFEVKTGPKGKDKG